jgi:hypothetical protein
MPETTYRNRRAIQIETDTVRVTVLAEGGHIAEVLHKPSGVNPLWTPPWPSIEPSTYSLAKHPEYGADAESKLLAGIMGHNLCMDIFGGVSDEEAAAGLTVHGEAAVAPYAIEAGEGGLVARAELPNAQLRFERKVQLTAGSPVIRFTETVENLSTTDRPIGWTEHVTLGPPFLEKGSTQFRLPATRSKVCEASGGMRAGAEFDWPNVPRDDGGVTDMRVFTDAPASAGYTAHLMDPRRDQVFFAAFSPSCRVLFGYVWNRADFPWLGIWEENNCRRHAPWNGRTLTRGMEFGASPVPETRRQMIQRGCLFGEQGFRWIPAKTKVRAEYYAFITAADAVPEDIEWTGNAVRFV